MDQPLYDIYFTGQLVDGCDASAAKLNLATLFKSTPEAAAKLFTGKPQLLKRGVDKAAALKYKAALHKAGLLVAFKAHLADTISAKSQGTDVPANNSQEEVWSLAPTGSELLKANERHEIPERDIDTSNIKMISAFANLEPEPKVVPPAPNTSHLSAAAVGEDLLVDKPEPAPPLPLNLEGITLAPPGTELEELHHGLPPLDPDTSALSIAQPGVDILEGEVKKPVPAAPNTDHISVVDD